MDQSIYKDLSSEELDILRELIQDLTDIKAYYKGEYILSGTQEWMAIFSNYLLEQSKYIKVSSSTLYVKQEQLDSYFPTAPDSLQATSIMPPFCYAAEPNVYNIKFIDTSTGVKAYEYAKQLVDANVGYTELTGISVALTQSTSHRVKIIRSKNDLWILTNLFNQKMVTEVLALFPYLFDIKELIEDKNIKDCCQAVTQNKSIKAYVQETLKQLEQLKEKQKIDMMLKVLNSRLEDNKAKVKQQIESTRRYITDTADRLHYYYEQLESQQNTLLGYETQGTVGNETVTEVLDFIKRNKYIKQFGTVRSMNYGSVANYLQLNIIAPINLYDPEPLERLLENRINDGYISEFTRYIYKAFKRIFIDEELTMICQTFVRLDLLNCSIDAHLEANNKSYTNLERMIQPHLCLFNCWGENLDNIRAALRNTDLIGAFNLMIIAAQNINFTDTVVFNKFIEKISNNGSLYNMKTCLSKADGNLWSISDIVEQIKREEKEEIEKCDTLD